MKGIALVLAFLSTFFAPTGIDATQRHLSHRDDQVGFPIDAECAASVRASLPIAHTNLIVVAEPSNPPESSPRNKSSFLPCVITNLVILALAAICYGVFKDQAFRFGRKKSGADL